jgi:signal transduction histidine kinase
MRGRTTLKRRLGRQVGLTVGGVAVLVGIAGLGVSGLRQDYGDALRANEQLREVYTVGAAVAAARSQLGGREAERERAAETLRRARGQFELLQQTRGEAEWLPETAREARAVRESLREAVDAAGTGEGAAAEAAIGQSYARIADLSAAIRLALTERQRAADAKHRAVLVGVVAAGLVTTAGVLVVGVRQYRAVVGPVGALQDAVRDFSGGRLSERVGEAGDAEFVALGRDFNRMADELERLYGDLRGQVEAKGRELARSERLASIGSLAAGVAHEINNPVAIIAGYAEQALRRMGRGGGDAGTVTPALEVIRDEAFRCRRITDQLLMLARPGNPERRAVDVGRVAGEAAEAQRVAAGGRVAVSELGGGPYVVMANEGEIRQVVLNLVANALEATAGGDGNVRVSVGRSGGTVELVVSDDGVGMAAETLARVFEPFFTTKRGGERPGTGLGLSVAHAIVRDHGGTIEARSDGVGRGSRMTVRLPAADGGGVGRG